MKLNKLFFYKKNNEQFSRLINVIRNDTLIKSRVKIMLELDSFNRRNVLNRWIEQLERKKASENLRQSLSCLFDDDIAEKTLLILKK